MLDWGHEREYRLAIPMRQGELPWNSLAYHPEEITKLLRSQPEPFSSHGLELSERLLATPQRQGQALVMITGQGYEAGMAHRL